MDSKQTLDNYKNKINKELELFFNIKIKEAENISENNVELVRAAKEFTLRGQSKRIRALLVLVGYFGYGGRNRKEIFRTAIFMELIHSYLLIHDDIMDNDDLRRGRPSMHKYYAQTARNSLIDREHYGLSMGILAGDLCNSFGQEILINSKFIPGNKLAALDELNGILSEVIAGQSLDVASHISKNVALTDILKIYYYKTARYTFELPLQAGAILAGAKIKDLGDISRYASPIGMAFQIKDDILGLFSTTAAIGKTKGSDIMKGKRTLIIAAALKKANLKDKRYILKNLSNKKITAKDLEKLATIINATGSLDYCQKLIDSLLNEAKNEITNNKKLNNNSKKLLLFLADYINNRSF